MTVRGYTLAVDWSRHGTYAGTLEDVTAYLNRDPIVVSWGRESTRTGLESAAGKLGFTLTNHGRQFSPENGSSPIAGKVLPGTGVRLIAEHAGAQRRLFEGVLDDVDADPGQRTFTGEALDSWGRPGAESLSTPVYTGVRTGDAIGLVLDAIGWTGGRDIDPGATLIPYWWEEGSDAATAVGKLVASEGPPAVAYVAGGTFTFRDRHHRITRTESTTSQGTYTHVIPTGSGPAGDFKILAGSFGYDHGLRAITNAVTFTVDQRQPGDTAEVWSTDSPIAIPAGTSVDVFAQPSEPFINAVAPAGHDLLVASGTVTAALSRTSGQSAVITLTAGGTDAVVSRLALRAAPLPVARTVKVVDDDTASINRYGRQEWAGDSPVWAGVYDAQAIAARIVSIYSTARPIVRLAISNLDSSYTAQILARQISDRITIRNDELGINADFIVEKITHTISGLGLDHRLELVCEAPEPTQPANIFTFGVAGKGFNQGAFGVDGIDSASTVFRFDVPGRGFNQGVFAS